MKLTRKVFTLVVIVCIVLSLSVNSFATDIPSLTLESYDEYQSFLRETKLPKDFVTYSDLAHFGEFDIFVRTCQPYENYNSYMYGIIDECDYDLTIYVDREYETPEYITNYPLLDISQINPSDMRNISSGVNGRYVISDITYWYISGTLTSIRWNHDGIYFGLCNFGPNFQGYPLDADTTVAKLLNIADKSGNELHNILKLQNILNGNNISPWIYVSAAVFVVLTSSVAITLWKRKKHKTKPEA